MRDIVSYLLLGLTALGLLVGVAGDLVDVLRCEPAPIEERLQRVLDRGVGRRGSAYPGALLYVASGPIGNWSGASGVAAVDTGEPMTADSRFCIGSITKTFVAVVVLQLMEEGIIDLDASIDTYLPEDLPVTVPRADQISARMLLNHTSGIPEWMTEDVTAQLVEDPSTVWEDEDILTIAFAQEMLFEPGKGFSYTNTEYTLLGLIIEELTGLSWAEQVQGRILGPLGLSDTVVRPSGETSRLPRMARGYFAEGGEFLDLTHADPSMAGAAGGNAMVSTTSDLAGFVTSLLDGDLFAYPQTLDQMLDWVDAPDENQVPYWYGLGVERYDIDGVTFIGHAGGAVGYNALMYEAPDAGITLTAANNGYGLAAAYLDLMIPALVQLQR